MNDEKRAQFEELTSFWEQEIAKWKFEKMLDTFVNEMKEFLENVEK